MSSVLESALGRDMIPSSTVGWDDIPTEIFHYIFKKMDITTLRCCFSVSKKWREIATHLCELQDLWQALAEDGIVNHGVTQRHKSKLSWKDLYFNSFLWKHLPSAAVYGIEKVIKKDIIQLHVYNGKDKLIVVCPKGFEYYDIETLQSIRNYRVTACVDAQESDEILMVVSNNDITTFKKVTVFIKKHKDEELNLHDFSFQATYACADSCCWQFVGNRVYVIDSRSCLWECVVTNKLLAVNALARFYGDYRFCQESSLSSIHVIDGDVYVSVEWGGLLVCAKNSRMFRKVNPLEIPTMMISFNNPFNVEFLHGSKAPHNMIHYHYEDPDMTAYLQHGDVVLRGFENGRVTINVLRGHSKYDLYVQLLDGHDVEDPEVTALEVYELKDMHKVFVATSTKLYAVLLNYPDIGLETRT